jgi:copper chaperone
MSDHHQYKFNVTMTCGGCSGAVERVLKKLDGMTWLHTPLHDLPFLNGVMKSLHYSRHHTIRSSQPLIRVFSVGVKSYDVSLDTQTATITTEPTLDYETVLEKIKKTGKKVNSGEMDGNAMAV